jgi:hypothetical protein
LESITLAGSYTFTNLGDAPIWSTHTFQVWFTSGVGHVTVDGGADHTVATDLTSGMLEARMEMHQATTLGFTGYFRNLQYYDGATWWAWGQPNTNCFFNCNYFQQVNYAPYCVYGGSATWFATDGLCYLRQGGGTFAKKVMPLWDARLSFDTNPPPPQPPSYVDLTLYFVIGTVAVFAVGFVLLNKFVLSARKRK